MAAEADPLIEELNNREDELKLALKYGDQNSKIDARIVTEQLRLKDAQEQVKKSEDLIAWFQSQREGNLRRIRDVKKLSTGGAARQDAPVSPAARASGAAAAAGAAGAPDAPQERSRARDAAVDRRVSKQAPRMSAAPRSALGPTPTDRRKSSGATTPATTPAAGKSAAKKAATSPSKGKHTWPLANRVCQKCGVKRAPGMTWRPGPGGSATLCSLCGVRWNKTDRDPNWLDDGGARDGSAPLFGDEDDAPELEGSDVEREDSEESAEDEDEEGDEALTAGGAGLEALQHAAALAGPEPAAPNRRRSDSRRNEVSLPVARSRRTATTPAGAAAAAAAADAADAEDEDAEEEDALPAAKKQRRGAPGPADEDAGGEPAPEGSEEGGATEDLDPANNSVPRDLTADRLLAYAQAVSRAVLTPVTRMSFPMFINRFTWNSASLSRYADNQTPAVTAAMEAISKHIEGLENELQAGRSIRGDFVSITGDRRELKLSTLAERKRAFGKSTDLLKAVELVHDHALKRVSSQLVNDFGWSHTDATRAITSRGMKFVIIWNDISKVSEPQEWHCDAGLDIGQLLLYLTRCKSAHVYCGNSSRETPTMKEILEMSVDEKERRVCEALGCPLSRMRHFAAIDREAYNHLCDFWTLLLPRDVLSPRMLSIDMDAGDMLFAGGPVQHCGSGHPKGKLRPVVFATVAGEYNIDFQISKYTLLLEAYAWRACLVEAMAAKSRGADPASHFTNLKGETLPVGKVLAAFAEAVERVSDAESEPLFLPYWSMELFQGYMETYPNLRQYFDMRTGKLLDE